jgi:Domain of unknown function (DUF4440)
MDRVKEDAMQKERAEVAQIRDVVSRLTVAWREQRWDDMTDLLDEEVVFENPGFSGRLEGRAACVDSYRQFMAAARVLDYIEHGLAIDTWGNTAVARTHWEMAWELDGQSQREAGHDILVLTQKGGRWMVAWRTLVPPADPDR